MPPCQADGMLGIEPKAWSMLLKDCTNWATVTATSCWVMVLFVFVFKIILASMLAQACNLSTMTKRDKIVSGLEPVWATQ